MFTPVWALNKNGSTLAEEEVKAETELYNPIWVQNFSFSIEFWKIRLYNSLGIGFRFGILTFPLRQQIQNLGFVMELGLNFSSILINALQKEYLTDLGEMRWRQ